MRSVLEVWSQLSVGYSIWCVWHGILSFQYHIERNLGHKNMSHVQQYFNPFTDMLVNSMSSPYSALLQVIQTYINILQLQP